MGKGANVVAVAAAGFIAGMLLAPKSGKETRDDLLNKAQDAKRMAGEKSGHMKEQMKHSMDAMHKNAKKVGTEVSDFADSSKRRANRIMNEEKDMMEEAKIRADRVSDTADKNNKL